MRILGKRPRVASALLTAGIVALLCAGGVTVGGCGGGGGQTGPSNPGNSSGTATVTGRVVENQTGTAVAGVTVSIGSQQVVTGADGTFSFTVSAGSSSTVVRVVGPAGYGDSGYVGGNITSLSTGFTLPVLTESQQYTVGDIQIVGPNSPPLPPLFPA